MRGKKCEIVVDEEEWEGVKRAKVKYINEIGGGGVMGERMPVDEAKAFAATLRQRILTARGPRPTSAPRQAPREEPKVGDTFDPLNPDSVPF